MKIKNTNFMMCIFAYSFVVSAGSGKDINPAMLKQWNLGEINEYIDSHNLLVNDFFTNTESDAIFDLILDCIKSSRDRILQSEGEAKNEEIQHLTNAYHHFSRGEQLGPILIADVIKRYYLDMLIDEMIQSGGNQSSEVSFENSAFLALSPSKLQKLINYDTMPEALGKNNLDLIKTSEIFWQSHGIINKLFDESPALNYVVKYKSNPTYPDVFKNNDRLGAGYLLLFTEKVRMVNFKLAALYLEAVHPYDHNKIFDSDHLEQIVPEVKRKNIKFTPFTSEPANLFALRLAFEKVLSAGERYWLISIK